jgi:RNA polymerase sigma factor (sigma-70 family)
MRNAAETKPLLVRACGIVVAMAAGSSWEQAAAGDVSAFASFYERHADRVFAHCYSRVGSRVDAEDLTSRVFEITWRRRTQVRPDEEAGILPWLLATANNVISEHSRAVTRASMLTKRLPPVEPEPDHASIVADRDELDHEMRLAMIVLRELRPADRDVIELCVLHGLSPTAAARVTGASPSTVRTRLARALVRARRLYRSVALEADGVVGAEVGE